MAFAHVEKYLSDFLKILSSLHAFYEFTMSSGGNKSKFKSVLGPGMRVDDY